MSRGRREKSGVWEKSLVKDGMNNVGDTVNGSQWGWVRLV